MASAVVRNDPTLGGSVAGRPAPFAHGPDPSAPETVAAVEDFPAEVTAAT